MCGTCECAYSVAAVLLLMVSLMIVFLTSNIVVQMLTFVKSGEVIYAEFRISCTELWRAGSASYVLMASWCVVSDMLGDRGVTVFRGLCLRLIMV